MSSQSAKKKRIGSRRRVANQSEGRAETDELHGTDSTSVAQCSISEEKTEALDVSANLDTLQSKTQSTVSPEPEANRRKLGSRRRNRGGHESATESYHRSRKDVEGEMGGNQTPETAQVTLTMQPQGEEELSQGSELDMSAAQDSSLHRGTPPDYFSEVQCPNTTVCQQADIDGLIPERESMQSEHGENDAKLVETEKVDSLQSEELGENVHLVGTSELTGFDVPSNPTEDQQLINQPNNTDVSEEELHNHDYSVTEIDSKEGDVDKELFGQDGQLQDNDWGSESVGSQFTTTPEITSGDSCTVENAEVEYSVEQEIFSSPKEELPEDEEQSEHVSLSEDKGPLHLEDDVKKVNEQEFEPTRETDRSSEGMRHEQVEDIEFSTGQAVVGVTYQSEMILKTTDDSAVKHGDLNPGDKQDEHPAKENPAAFEEIYDTDKLPISGTQRRHIAPSLICETDGKIEDDLKAITEQTDHRKEEGILFEVEDINSAVQTLQSETNAPLDSQTQDNAVRTEEDNNAQLNPLVSRRKLGSSRRNKGRQQVKRSVDESCDDHKREAVETGGNETPQTTQISEALERTSQEESSQGSDHDVAMSVTHDSSFYSAITPNDPSEVENPFTTNYPQTDLESLITKSDLQEQHDGRDSDLQVEVSDKPVEVVMEEKDKSDSLQTQEVRDAYYSEEDVNTMHEPEVKPTHEINDSSEIVTYDAPESSAMISGNLISQTEVSDTDQSELIGKDSDDSNKPGEHLTEDNSLEAANPTNQGYDMPEEQQVRGIERVDTEPEQKYESEDQEEENVKPIAEKIGEERIFSEMEETNSSLQTLSSELHVSTATESYHRPTEEGVGNAIDEELLDTTKMSLTVQAIPREKSVEGMDTLDTVQTEEVSAQVKERAHCSISEHTATSFTEDQQPTNQSHFREMPEEDVNLSEVTEHRHAEGVVNEEHEDVVKLTQMPEMHQIDFSSNLEDEFTLQTLESDTNAPLDNSLRTEEETHTGLGNRRKLGSSRRNKGRQQGKRSVAESCDDHKREAVETRGNETPQTTHISEALERTSQEESSQGSDHDVAMSVTHDSSFYSAITPNDPSEVENPSTTNYPQTDLESLITKSDLQEQHDGRDFDLLVEVSDKPVEVVLEEKDESDSLQTQEVRDAYYSEEDVNTMHEPEVKQTHEINDSSEIVTYDAPESSAMISGNLISQTEVSDTDQSELIGKDSDDSNKPDEHLTEDNSLEAANPTNQGYGMPEEQQVRGIERVDTEQEQKYESEDQEEENVKPIAEKIGEERIFSEMEETNSSLQTLSSELHVSTATESYHRPTEEGVGNAIDNEPLDTTKLSLTVQVIPQEKSVEGMDTLDTVQIEEVSAQVKERAHCSISEHTATSFTEDQQPTNQSHFREMPEEDVNLSEVTEHRHAEGVVNEEHEDVVKPTQMPEMHQIDFSSNLEDEFTLQTLESDTNAPLDFQLLDNSLRTEEETHTGLSNRRKLGSSRRNKGRQQGKRSVAESCDDHKREALETTGNETPETTHISEALERTSQEESSQGSDHDVAMSVTHDSSFYSAITPNDPSEVENPFTTNDPQTDLESLITKSDLQEQHDGRDSDLQVEVSDKPVEVVMEEKDESDSLQTQEVRDAYYSEEDVNTMHEPEVKQTHEINNSSEIVTYDAPESSAMISGNLRGQAEDDSNKLGEHLTEENNLEAAYHKKLGYDITEDLQVRGTERVETEQEQKYESKGQEEGNVKLSADKIVKERMFSEMEETNSSSQSLPSEICASLGSQPEENDTDVRPFVNRRKLASSRRNKAKRHANDSVTESYHWPVEESVGNTINDESLETTMSLPIQTSKREKSVEGMDSLDTVQTEEVKERAHCSISEHTATSFTEDQQPTNQSHFREMPEEDVNLSEVTEHRHAEGVVNEEHEDVVKPTPMQEMHQIDFSSNLGDEFALQTLQQETNAPLDSQLLDNALRTEEQTHTGLGNRRKLGSSRRNKGRQQVKTTAAEYHEHIEAVESTMDNETLDTTKMSLEENTSQEDFKNSGPSIIKTESAVNDEEDIGKMLEEDAFLSQSGMNNSTNVTSNITSSSGRRDSFKSNDIDDEEKKELTNLGYDTVKIDLIQSPEDDSGIKNVSHHDDNPTTGPIRLTFSEKEGTLYAQKKEVLSFDKDLRGQEINTAQTSSATATVGDVTIKDSNTEAEPLVDVQVLGQDEVGERSGDFSVKEHEDKEINASQENTHTEGFFTAHDKAPFGLEQNFRAVSQPAMDTPQKSGNSATAGACNAEKSVQGKTYLGDRENSQERSKQKRRKMGSTRRTQLNRNPEEGMDNTDETKESDKNEVVEELPKILSVEVAQNKNAKQSVTHDQSASHSEDAVKFEVAAVRDSETSADVVVESPPQDDFIDTEMLMTSVLAGGNICSTSSLPFTEAEDATSGITGRMYVCDTTQEGEERPDTVTQEQGLKAADLAATDLEIVKSVVRGGAGGQIENAQTNVQDANEMNEGIHNKNPQMKSPNLNSPDRRRKMGSTRKNFGSRNKGGDLHQKQEVDNEATETATGTDVKTESVPDIKEKELQLHTDKDSDSEQRKEKVLETVECSHTGESHFKPPTYQTHEEDAVSHVDLVETQRQPSPNYLQAMPATSQKHEVTSDSASGGRRRKMGSHRKSRVHQNNENETEREDRPTDARNVRDVGSVADEKANKTNGGESSVLDKISEDDESDKKPSSNISTSKAGQDSRPVGEKPVEQVAPVQHRYTEIRLGQESPEPFSLAGGSSGDNPECKRYNVVLVGDSSVGKSSFMKRAHSGKFSLDLPASVGLDTCMWTVVVDGKPVVLQLWDTAGQERYHSMTRQILHKAHAFLLMYDITSSQSFSAVSYWANCIQEGAPENVTILLLGNKSDHAERRIKSEDGEVLAKEYNFEFMECSAATGENIIQSLETVARMLSQNVDTRGETTVLQREPKQNKKSGCC